MSNFLTVKEAAVRTGKSPSSIRRIIYPIIHDDAHPDRSHVEPNPEEALTLRLKGENFAWRLSEELLQREVPIADLPTGATPPLTSSADAGKGELLDMLRRELDIKNAQITRQSELLDKQLALISGLSERLREGNVLMGTLQQRLALTDRRDGPVSEGTKAGSITEVVKGTTTKSKTKPPRRGLISRIFRRRS